MKLQRVLLGGCLCVFLGLAASSCADGKSIDRRTAPRQIGGSGEKVTMCHVPPADPASATTIEVESADVARHMDQGDRLGPCTAEDLACTPLGQPCTEDAECCTESCLGERCNPHCRPSGAACETDGNCCSDDCNKGHCRS